MRSAHIPLAFTRPHLHAPPNAPFSPTVPLHHRWQTSGLSTLFALNRPSCAEGRTCTITQERDGPASRRRPTLLPARAGARSFAKGQSLLTPCFLVDERPTRGGFQRCQNTVRVTFSAAPRQPIKADPAMKEIWGLTYRKPGSPLRTSKGACMLLVWAQSMSG